MGIYQGSRYRFSDIIQSSDADGESNGVYELRPTTTDIPDGSVPYTVQAKDTFESLAHKYYGDGNKWYVIADANPNIFWSLDLTQGELIYIPPKSYAAVV